MEENEKIIETEQKKPKGSPPNFKGDGIAVWVNLDKNGKQYLTIKIVGHNNINAFAYEVKNE